MAAPFRPPPLPGGMCSSNVLNPYELKILFYPAIEGQQELTEAQWNSYCAFFKKHEDKICDELGKIFEVKVNHFIDEYTTSCTVHTLEKLNSMWNQFCSEWEAIANKMKGLMESENCCQEMGIEPSKFVPKVYIDEKSYKIGLVELQPVTSTPRPPPFVARSVTHAKVGEAGDGSPTGQNIPQNPESNSDVQNVPQVQVQDGDAQKLTASKGTDQSAKSDQEQDISEDDIEKYLNPNNDDCDTDNRTNQTESFANVVKKPASRVQNEGTSVDVDSKAVTPNEVVRRKSNQDAASSGTGANPKQPQKDNNKPGKQNKRDKDKKKNKPQNKVQDNIIGKAKAGGNNNSKVKSAEQTEAKSQGAAAGAAVKPAEQTEAKTKAPAADAAVKSAEQTEAKSQAPAAGTAMQSTVFTVYVPIRYKAVASQMWVYYRSRQQSDDDATGVEMCQNKDYPQLWESKQINIPAADGVEYVYYYMMFQKMSKVMVFFKPDEYTFEKGDRDLNFCFDPLDIFYHPDVKYSYDNDMLQGCWTYIQFYNSNLTQSDLKTKLIALSDSKILEYFKKFYSAYSHNSYVMADLPKLMKNTSQKMFLVFILVKCLPVYSLNNGFYFDKSLAKVCCDAFIEADLSHFPSQSNAILQDVVLFLCRIAFGGTNPFVIVKYFYRCLTLEDCSTLIKKTYFHTQTSKEIGDCFQVLIPELKKGVEKGKIVCLLLLEQITSFESILSISDTLNRVSDIPSPFRDAIKSQTIKCSKERASASVAACIVRTQNAMKELQTLVCKIIHTELQTGLSEKLENKVLDIIKERRCEWDRSEIESLHFILVESFLFQADSVTEVYREIVKSSQSSTQRIFLDILKKTEIITVGMSEVCINWLKKAVESSRQKHNNREKRVCEMYLSIGSLLDVKSIEDNSELSSDLEKIVKSEVDKVDIKILMSAAENIEKIPEKGKKLYNLHVQERLLMYEDKFKHGNLNLHLEAVLGSSNEIWLDLHSHYSYLQVMLSKVPLYQIQDTCKVSHDISTVVDIIGNITFWYKLFRCKGTYSDRIKQHQSARNVVAILQNVMHNIEEQTTSVHFANKILELLKKMDSNERVKLCIIIKTTDVPTLDKVLQQLQNMLKDVGYKLKCISDLLEWLVKYEGADCINNSRLHIEGLDVQLEQFEDLSKSVLASLEYKLCDVEQAMGLRDQWYLSDAIQVQKVLQLHSFHQFILHCFLTDTNVSKEIEQLNDDNVGATNIGDEVRISTRGHENDFHPQEDLIEIEIDFDIDEAALDVSVDDIDMDNNLDDIQKTIYKSGETLSMTSKIASLQVQSVVEIISNYVPKYINFLQENVFSESEVHVCDIQFLFLTCTREIELQHLSNMMGGSLPERTINFVRYLQEYDQILRKASEFVRLCNVFDLKTKEDKSTLMCAIREIIDLNENKDSMTAKMLWRSMTTFENLTSAIDGDIWDILHELSKSSSLIQFLRSVMNEDLRNLIDAVEEHSEQFVQESTVSDLIQMTSLLKPILSKDIPESLDKLVQELLTCFSSRKKGIPQMINNCSLNCNGLKALYMNVANRGEVTKEIVMKILKKGVVSFNIENDTVMACIQYRTTDSQINYNITDLNDLRSRVLLISNTEGPDENQTETNKGYLGHFVQICDLVVDISLLLENLHALGHFAFQKYHYESTQIETNKRIQELTNLLTETEVVQSTWQRELASVQSKFYYMNFIHSKQICILSDYFTSGKHRKDALSILKYIKPTLDIEKTMDTTFEHGAGLANIQFQLERLAAAIHSRISSIPDVYIPFPEDENFVKQIENVDAKVNQGEVYVAHIDVKCTDTIPILLALYANTTKLFPLPSQVLFCDEQTTWEEIQLLINRCVLKPEEYKDNLFCIVGVEKLPYEIQYHLVQCLKDLERDNISSRKDFLLAILCCAVSHNNFLTSLSSNVHQAPSIVRCQFSKKRTV